MKAVKVSLVSFLKTGVLGPIRRGMPFRELTQLVGPPGDIAYWKKKVRRPSVAWYGSIELGFSECAPSRVHYIQIEHSHLPTGHFAGHRLFFLDGGGFNPQTATAISFEHFARRNGVRLLSVLPPWRSDDQMCFLTQGGVVAWFSKDLDTGCTRFDTFITENQSRFTPSYKPIRFVQEMTIPNAGNWRDPKYQRKRLRPMT